ncbi:reverse transcriptase domain-containing protein [Salmonella enterica]|uniref:reverse transcriptase domain-containing protein n=1 Tax=Salmonella enterica TaxID=28901 RepID=UPI0021B26854|nr:reverse transcriptase domain-containing protein [Salmonella enterica]
MPRGSALSPLLAAFHLTETDNVFSRNRHVTYARYMDDFLILSPTRWHLRRAVRMLNRLPPDRNRQRLQQKPPCDVCPVHG